MPRELAHAIDGGGAIVLVGPRCSPSWRPGGGAVLASPSAGSTGYELLAHAGATARAFECPLWLTLARGGGGQPGDDDASRRELLAANMLARMSRAFDGHGLTVGWDVIHDALHRSLGTFGEALSMVVLEVERCDHHRRRDLWSEAIAVARRSEVPVFVVAASARPLPQPPVPAKAPAVTRASPPPRRATGATPAAPDGGLRDHWTVLTLLGPTASTPVATPVPPTPLTRRALLGVVSGIAVLVVILLTLVGRIEVPYATVEPGDAPDLALQITVSGTETDPIHAPIRYLTVRAEHATLLDALRGWLDRDVDVVPDPNTTSQAHQAWSINNDLMIASKQTAELVALSVLGRRIVEHGDGARVAATTPGSVAASALQIGDVIVGVDRSPTGTAADVAEAVARGGFHLITVRRQGTSAPVNMALVARSSTDGTSSQLGAALETVDARFEAAVDLTIDTAHVVGPSAGLAFTLATIDLLSPGDLTGGLDVAATGTIALDGQVGVIGALRQKVLAARHAGADALLVPIEQEIEAERYADGTPRVIGVHTINDALAVLKRLGGDRPTETPARRRTSPASVVSI